MAVKLIIEPAPNQVDGTQINQTAAQKLAFHGAAWRSMTASSCAAAADI